MKNVYAVLTVTLFSFITLSAAAQKQITYTEKFGFEASVIFPGADHVWLKEDNMIPAFIQLRTGSETDEATFFALLKKVFHLPSYYNFLLLANNKDELGWEHHRYQLQIYGVPVTDGIFITHLLHGKVKKYNGALFKNIHTATSPSLSESSALQSALDNTNAQRYKWELPEENEQLKQETGNPLASYFPKGKLEIVHTANTFRLAWKFDIYAYEPMSRNEVFVDAETGAVIKKNSLIQNANAAGTAVTVYRGSKPIVADSYTGQYRLKETIRGLGVHTYNMLQSNNYGNAAEFLDADNVWNNVNANLDQYAGDAHWGAEMTYDFYQTMGRNSIDDAGYALNLYVHYNTNYVNAFWDGTRMTFGDGDNNSTPLVSLDITGHEISHGLDEHTANLDYQDESGALNESFSDIFGTAVEWFADSLQGNWLIGEDIGGAFRSMSNPNTYGDPDTYLGTNWYTGTADNGGVHTNSNVQNFWYYILSDGKSGTNDIGNAYSVTGITRHKATQIAWRNMVFYLTNTSQYTDSRFYAIQSANDLFGTCSPEAIATTNAWYAVGVGGQFVYGVDAQFSATQLNGCQVPTTITFTNASSNASVYTWDFGDGTTSNAQAPSHAYSSFGTYTVRLISDGGSCGIDSLIRANYVNISASNPCIVILPPTGTYETQTSCTGTIYDSGGPTGNYGDMTNSTVTIAPVGATQVRLHFTQFDMENTYDFLYVYDGPTTASPQIGAFTGTTIPADVLSSGSSITIRQSSDPAVVGAGFTIQWTCIAPTVPPVANFVADVTNTCTGKINFTDLSTSTPVSWLWNFGDGGTSTLKNPSHTYFTSGNFTVSLQATNAFGSNTNTKTDYITVSKPAAPTASNANRCGTGTVSLSAASTDSIKWYANATDTIALATINPFITPSLSTTTTYYAEDIVPGATSHVGPVNDSIGTGGYYANNTDRYLIFNCLATCTLQTVKVYAQASGSRIIVLRDSTGAILQTLTANLSAGLNVVTLNFTLPVKNNLRLGINGTANLYRNTSGGIYPYTLAGLVSITGTNGTAGYYYYYYDWVIKAADCVSLRKAVTATINPLVSVTATHTNVLCNGENTGTATAIVNSGTPGYTYAWNGGANTATAANLVAGTYNVTVTDAAGCTGTATQTVTQPLALSVVKTITGDTCVRNTGKVISTVSGGTSSYNYLWSNNATSSTIQNLNAATYTLTVHDANNCSLTTSATVNAVSSTLSLTAGSTNVLCNGGNTGSATATVTGGFPTVVYAWSNNATTATIINLIAGTYNVTVTDGGGCSASVSRSITEPTALSVSKIITGDTCGRSTGKVISAVSGGASGYTYSWSNNATSSTIQNLSAATYTLTVHDANNCSLTTTAIVNAVSSTLSLSATSTNVLCNGGNTGSATVTATGGFPDVVYAWSNSSNTSVINNLIAGTYNVTVTDGGGCSASASRSVTEPTALAIAKAITGDTCNNNTGKVIATVSGGTSGYTYAWSNSATVSTIQNLSVGIFTLTVHDANNCSLTTTANVSAVSSTLSLSASSTNVLCNGGTTGSVTANITGGFPTVVYLWSNSATSFAINNLAIGTYSVTATDGGGCSASVSKTITQPTVLTLGTTTGNATCLGNDGSVQTQVSGGTSGYTYQWNTGVSGAVLQNIAAGNYLVTVTDANGCNSSAAATVNAPGGVSVNASSVNVACFGNASGSAGVVVTAGASPYTYHWNNGNSSSSLINLSGGNYSVTVVDANSCSAVAGFTIAEPSAALNVSATALNATCAGNDGSVSLTVTGGTSAYSYQWNTGASSVSLQNIAAGNYLVTVTDANSCSITSSAIVNAPGGVSVNSSSVNVACFGDASGSAGVVVTAGASPFSYAWSNGSTSSSLSNVSAGNYSITVVDANSCSAVAAITIAQPVAALTLNANVLNASLAGNDGAITLTVSGGTPAYTYNWNTGETTSSLTNLTAGNYALTVTDAHGCSVSFVTTISAVSCNGQLSTYSTDVLCYGGFSGKAAVAVTGGTLPLTYLWNTGSTDSSVINLPAGVYSVTVHDAQGCLDSTIIIINEPIALTMVTNTTAALCFGDSSGTADVFTTGGVPSLHYLWSNGDTGSAVTGLSAGAYEVTVTDANSCSASADLTIVQPSELIGIVTTTDVWCFGEQNGTAQIILSGGTADYSFHWCNGDTASLATNLAVGVCGVTVTDQNGCTLSTTVHISQPAQMQVVTSSANATSGQSNGTAFVDAITGGGGAPYQLIWSTGDTVFTSGTSPSALNNLAAGTYTVTVTDAFGCSITASVVVDAVSGITTPVVENMIQVFPNPAHEQLTVSSSSVISSVKLFDVLGQTAGSRSGDPAETDAHRIKLNVSGLAAGVYMLEVNTAGMRIVKRVVVE